MSPGLIAGWGLLFVLMAGELTAASILANARSPVVGFVILEIFESGSYGILAALATIVSLMSALIICGVSRSEEHTSELQSLIRTPYAGFCLKKKNKNIQ